MRDPSANRALLQQEIRDRLQSRGVRLTKPRLAIIEAIFAQEEHFDADLLLDRARAIDPSVSLSSVYRTLKILLDHDCLRTIELGDGQRCYDPNPSTQIQQQHVVCLNCQKVLPFQDPCLHLREQAILAAMGFKARELKVMISAECEALKREGSCPHANLRVAAVPS